MQELSIGIIGTGEGKTVGQMCKTLDPNCKIYLTARDAEKTARIAKEIDATDIYSNWEEMMEDPKIHLVVIATPNHLHKSMFEAAVKNKKHILLEKPAGLSSSEITEMQQLTANYPYIVAVNHELRFHPTINYMRNLIQNEDLGTILTVRFGGYLNLFTSNDYQGSWYNDKQQGGGQLLAFGSHQIDLVRYLLNMPKIVSGAIQTKLFQNPHFTPPVDVESQFTAHFITDSGTHINMFNDTYCFGHKDLTIEVIGSKGIALYSDTQGLRTSFANDQPLQTIEIEDSLEHIPSGPSLFRKAMKFAAQDLLTAVRENKENPTFCTLEVAKENLEILERFA